MLTRRNWRRGSRAEKPFLPRNCRANILPSRPTSIRSRPGSRTRGSKSPRLTGKGQTIAILIDTFPDNADLKKFWKLNKIKNSTANITKINVNSLTPPPPSGEETMDVEWSSGIAPGAKIRIYASGTLDFVNLDAALDRIFADLPSQPGMLQA